MRSTYAKLAAVAVFFIMLIVYVRSGGCEVVNPVTGKGEPSTLTGVCFQEAERTEMCIRIQVELLPLKTLQEKTWPEKERLHLI